MTNTKHLTIYDRETIFGLLKQRKSLNFIAFQIGKTAKTVRLEVKKNSKYGRAYSPCKAQYRADRVGRKQRTKAPLKNPKIYLSVRQMLREKLSPEQISGRINLEFDDESISKDTIYNYIYSTKARREKFTKFLYYSHHKRRLKKVKITSNAPIDTTKISIELRPKTINNRSQLGHFESDLIEGPRNNKFALSVEIERTSRYTIINKVQNKTADEKTRVISSALLPLPKYFKRSTTVDNGTENSGHDEWRMNHNIQVYFARPYKSCDKGTVENMNGRIRRFFPKGTNFEMITNEQIKQVQNKLNNTPRKCLNYLTPIEFICKARGYKLKSKLGWGLSK